MKIVKLETFDTEFVCFVRVTDETGATGWGQLSTYCADISAEVFHRQVAPHALGSDTDDLEDTLVRIYEREHKFPGSYLRRAQTGLDTAVWDLRGKLAGKPVVSLLGGTPGKVRAYASSMRRDITPKDEAARLVRLRDEKGFTAFKWRVGAEYGRDADEWPGSTEEVIPFVSKALGDDVEKLVDGNSGFTPRRAIEVGRMLEQNGIGHFEEPCRYWDYDQTAEVRRALSIDVAGGEQDCELSMWQLSIEHQAVDILQPASCILAGCTGRWRSAAWARPPGCRSRPMRRILALSPCARCTCCGRFRIRGNTLSSLSRGWTITLGRRACSWAIPTGSRRVMPR